MSLSSTLSTALSGLRSTQAGIDLVSKNVANADSVGYTKRRLNPTQQLVGDRTNAVDPGAVQRVYDQAVQRQMFLERSGAAYATTVADYTQSLDRLYGSPGSANSLDGAINDFGKAIGGLADNPGDFSNRADVLSKAENLTARIGSISNGIQDLRTSTERRLSDVVERANGTLSELADLNTKIAATGFGSPNAALEDERDRLITELSSYLDVSISTNSDRTVTIRTETGQTLVDRADAYQLKFEGAGRLDAKATLNNDSIAEPQRLGVLTVVAPGGAEFDLTRSKMIRSGEIAALFELRDETLVQAQVQMDELATGLARSFSDLPVSFTDDDDGSETTVSFNEPAADQALSVVFDLNGERQNLTVAPDPGQSLNYGQIAAEFNRLSELSDIEIENDGGTAIGLTGFPPEPDFEIISMSTTALKEEGAGVGLPLFVSANPEQVISGDSDIVGLAERLRVNTAFREDPGLLTRYADGIASGDTTRAEHMRDALTGKPRMFSAEAAINGMAAPFQGTVSSFARAIVNHQGAVAENAQNIAEGQKIALASIESRFAEKAGVNIDEEMANLLKLQNSYGANARVMTAAREMLDMLMRM